MSDTPEVGTGRPRKPIDWKLVDEMLYAGCLGTEIAASIGVCADTLYQRCVEECRDEKGNQYLTFSAYSQEKSSVGESILRRTQFNKAQEGDTSMLIWLGKNRLGQRDNKDMTIANPQGEVFKVEDIKNLPPSAIDDALTSELSQSA